MIYYYETQCRMVWIYAWFGFCMCIAEYPSLRFMALQWCKWKTKFLGESVEGLFRNSSNKISPCIHIVRTSRRRLFARSEIFCLLVEVVYWPCGSKFVYQTMNLAFLWKIVKVKYGTKFCLHSYIEMEYPKLSLSVMRTDYISDYIPSSALCLFLLRGLIACLSIPCQS